MSLIDSNHFGRNSELKWLKHFLWKQCDVVRLKIITSFTFTELGLQFIMTSQAAKSILEYKQR